MRVGPVTPRSYLFILHNFASYFLQNPIKLYKIIHIIIRKTISNSIVFYMNIFSKETVDRMNFFKENVFLLSCSRWLSFLLESICTEIRKVYVFDLLSVTLLYACIRHVSHTKSFCIVFHYIYYA